MERNQAVAIHLAFPISRRVASTGLFLEMVSDWDGLFLLLWKENLLFGNFSRFRVLNEAKSEFQVLFM